MQPSRPRHDDLSAQRRVDDVCLAFEAAWQGHLKAPHAHPRPAPEGRLASVPEPDRALLLRELLRLDAAYRRQAGESPTAEDYLPRFPGWEETVRLALSPGPPALAPGASVRYFGDYEILGEVGRGGMGVIYRARQRSLNRVVALKMIRADQLPGAAEVQRFRLEAEAAAHLEHEGIVPVYEVGEHDGQQYFTMRLIEGGSLAGQPGRFRASPRAAAGLVAQVVRAIHHAHQRGILHRDLKPANVLLGRDGRPHVTDFGLAKLLAGYHASPGQGPATISGSVLGTVAYLAPEQARAEKAVTTAVDVYGLGAVLYELLTGHPPFQAGTPAETLLKVLNEEPTRPRAANPAVDRDLETVCLKCLEKDPRRRYGSAAEVADELERWLRGEPILARPVGAVERGWRWCQRNPVVAALLAAVLLTLVISAAVSSMLAVEANARAREAAAARAEAEEGTRTAEAARDELQESKNRLERSVARSLLRPLALVGTAPPPLSDVEAEALSELSSSEPGLKLLFVHEALRAPLPRRQFRGRAAYALHAAVGLDAALRDRAEHVLGGWLQEDRPDEERVDVTEAAVRLGLHRPAVRSRTASILIRAMERTPDGNEMKRLAGSLSLLAARMDAGEAAAAATAVLAAMGRKKPDGVGPLAVSLAALAARMDAEEAGRLCRKAAGAVAVAMEQTTKEEELWTLAEGLSGLVRHLEAPPACLLVVRAMRRPMNALSLLVNSLSALASRMDSGEALPAAAAAVEAMSETTNFSVLHNQLSGLYSLAGRLNSRDAGTAALAAAQALGKSRDRYASEVLTKGLKALAARADAKDAAPALAAALLGVSRTDNADALWGLAQGISALAARVGPENAAAPCAKASDVIMSAYEKAHERFLKVKPTEKYALEDATSELWKLSSGLEPLAHWIAAPDVLPLATRFLQAVRKISDKKGELSLPLLEALQALAPRMDPRTAGKVAAELEDLGNKDLLDWKPLFEGLSVLAGRMEAGEASALRARAAGLIVRTMVRQTDPASLSRTAENLTKIAEGMNSREAAVAAAPVVQALGKATKADELRSLAETLKPLAARLNSRDAPAAAQAVAAGIGRTDERFALIRLAECLSTLASGVDSRDTATAAGAVLSAMTRAEGASALNELAQTLSDLVNHLDAKAAASFSARAARDLAQRIGTKTNSDAVKDLNNDWNAAASLVGISAQSLGALAARMPPRDAAAVCGKAAADIARVMGKVRNVSGLDNLADGLLAAAARMDPKDSTALYREAAAAAVRALEDPQDPRYPNERRLAEIVAAVAARLGPRDAAPFCAQASALVSRALDRAADNTSYWGPADGLAALAPWMDPRDVPPAVSSVVRALDRTTDAEPVQRLSAALAALAARLDARDAAQAAASLLDSRRQTDPERVAVTAARELRTLLTREAPDDHRRRALVVAAAAGGLGVPGMVLAAGGLLRPAYPPAPPPLPAQALVDLLKHPSCVGDLRREVLAQLSRHHGRPFADQWEFAAFAAARDLGLDLTTPVRRPGP